MGEAKRKRDAMTPQQRLALDLGRKLANDGMLIAGGWAAYAINNGIEHSNPNYEELRIAYLSGTEHVFSSMFGPMLDECREETQADYDRMDLLHREIIGIRELLKLRFNKAEGSA